ncbi:hypothetical protein IWX90DRAFT_98716 [Phyllosticta citrichinensis]|uniref:Uncharacterized protein n=1 Tax=Phyllosticta citrichinensis TaxID=1130410 RepID=A0ABR1Y1V7_9PEZI
MAKDEAEGKTEKWIARERMEYLEEIVGHVFTTMAIPSVLARPSGLGHGGAEPNCWVVVAFLLIQPKSCPAGRVPFHRTAATSSLHSSPPCNHLAPDHCSTCICHSLPSTIDSHRPPSPRPCSNRRIPLLTPTSCFELSITHLATLAKATSTRPRADSAQRRTSRPPCFNASPAISARSHHIHRGQCKTQRHHFIPYLSCLRDALDRSVVKG